MKGMWKILLIALVVSYVVSPDIMPGPIDDILVMLLGMAARHIQILSAEELQSAIRTIFARKGDAVVEANLKAFQAGFEG